MISCSRVLSIVLKPGPARRVDPGPGRPGPGTGPGLSKNPPGSWPGETRSTRRVNRNPVDPGKPGYRFLRIEAAVLSLLSFFYLITQLQFSQPFISCHEFQRCKSGKPHLHLYLFLSGTMMSSKLNMVFWCLLYSRTAVPTSKQTFLFLVMIQWPCSVWMARKWRKRWFVFDLFAWEMKWRIEFSSVGGGRE